MFEAMGGMKTAVSIKSIHAVANCTAPHGEYVTEIQSARDQRLHFRQEWPGRQPFVGIIAGQHAWTNNAETGEVQKLAESSVLMLRSHEFQMIPLTLPERFSQMTVVSEASFVGEMCHLIQANDELGNPCTLYFNRQSGLMAGFTMANPIGEAGETVQTVFNQWQIIENIKLPMTVTATDKNGDFILDFHTVELNNVDTTIFAVPAGIA
jgi:hypothetical protein